VGRALKGAGWRVASSDLMSYSYVFQQAYVVASHAPSLSRLAREVPEVRRAFREQGVSSLSADAIAVAGVFLATGIEPEQGFVAHHFSPLGDRMYFTQPNAERIDAARQAVEDWRRKGWIDDTAYYALLAAIIEGADRVANTAGVYAAYIKSWQSNARRQLTVVPVPPVAGPRGSTARMGDATEVAAALGEVDLLYIDPPYNGRQYPGYYHVPELLARGWFDGPVTLRGKTGLLPSDGQRSDWCAKSRVGPALRALLGATGARHVLVSYNSEGLLPDREVRATLGEAAVDGKVRRFTKRYKRYRADSESVTRRYSGSVVTELLYYVRLR